MNREEQIAFCRKCTNRKFDPDQGIICRLTDQKADFQGSCPDFNLDEHVKENKYEPESPLEARDMIERLSDETVDELRKYQDFPSAIIGGLLLMIIGGLVWATVSVVTGYQIGYLAIGIGFLVGFGVRYFGAGVDVKFGILAGALSVVSCLLGNIFALIAFSAQTEGLTYLQTIGLIDFSLLPGILAETFSPIDILFYALAVGAAYKYAFRAITPEELEMMHQKNIDPVPPGYNIRRPVVIVASVILLGFVFLTNRGTSGAVSFTYEDGSRMSEGSMVDGLEDGEWTYWYPSGKVQAEVNMTKGIPDGSWTLYYESGKKMTEGAYDNGNQAGLWINYHTEGQVSDSGRYVMGREQGAWAYYYEGGQLIQGGIYNSGRKEGPWEMYHENGQLLSQGKMKDDEQVGVWKQWYDTGKPENEQNFTDKEALIINLWTKDGQQTTTNGNGTFEDFYATGELMGKGRIKNGKRDGEYLGYHPDSSKEQQGVYAEGKYRFTSTWKPDGTAVIVNGTGHYEQFLNQGLVTLVEGDLKEGLKDGTWYTYYESGNIQSSTQWVKGAETGRVSLFYESGNTWAEGMQVDGEPAGDWVTYYEDETVETTIHYKDGKKDGTQTFWNAYGSIIKEELYENGKLIETRGVD